MELEHAENPKEFNSIDFQSQSASEVTLNNNTKNFSAINNLTYTIDTALKSLTARTPEAIAEQTGLYYQSESAGELNPENINEALFPNDGDILYIGDPWQRMGCIIDRPEMHIIDYEFGDIAAFETNLESFFEHMLISDDETYSIPIVHNIDINNTGYAELLLQIGKAWMNDPSISEKDKEWFITFHDLIEIALNLSSTVNQDVNNDYDFHDYVSAADAWQTVREHIESAKPENSPTEYNENSDIAEFRTAAWYRAVKAERGFTDLPDWFTVIAPRLSAYRQSLLSIKDLPGFEKTESQIDLKVANMKRQLIHAIRFEQKPQHANVTQAAFPDLSFYEVEKFSRIIASWSLTAHVLSHMDQAQMTTCWQEFDRLLKECGKAYLFPMTYDYQINFNDVFDTLDAYCQHDDVQLEYYFLDDFGSKVLEDTGNDIGYTLVLHKVNK